MCIHVLTCIFTHLGTNRRTGLTGDFPGASYSELIEEVFPEPSPPPVPIEPSPPPPPPRTSKGPMMSPTRKGSVNDTGTPPPTAPRRSPMRRVHDMYKITIHIPLPCVVCK